MLLGTINRSTQVNIIKSPRLFFKTNATAQNHLTLKRRTTGPPKSHPLNGPKLSHLKADLERQRTFSVPPEAKPQSQFSSRPRPSLRRFSISPEPKPLTVSSASLEPRLGHPFPNKGILGFPAHIKQLLYNGWDVGHVPTPMLCKQGIACAIPPSPITVCTIGSGGMGCVNS